ncbi:unnamed protein product [Pieris macdunnoughi]|uniref:BESS domain-containing protein n=1 Tax=Pieris macdunnoughi TaxID=345717 RepID=A0A821UDG4_9NEOP|nr:unnamed protein product [Pieris macdunnoughi]
MAETITVKVEPYYYDENAEELKSDEQDDQNNGCSGEIKTEEDALQMNIDFVDVKSEIDTSIVKDEPQENSSTIEADQVPTTSYAVPKTKDKKLKRKSDDDFMQLAVNRFRQKPDEYENWAAFSAADLKKMEPTQQIFAKSAIAAIIMEGQLGLLHRNSVKINTPTVTITPYPTYTRSTPTPTNYNSTPSPRYSENPPEELPHYQQDNQQNMDNSQQENDANDMSQYIKLNK